MRSPARSVTLVRSLRLAMLAALAPALAGATSYNISTFADDAVVNGNCTLREAIRASNLDAATDACAAGSASDVITLPSGTYPFSGQEILSNGGSLTIRSATLDPLTVSIDLSAAGRFLLLGGGGNYVLAGLEIKNGLVEGTDAGGAIYSSASLEIYNFRFLSNYAAERGGALYFLAILPSVGLSLHDGTFIDNHVTPSGGAFQLAGGAYARATNGGLIDIRDVIFLSNSGSTSSTGGASGGALILQSRDVGSWAACIRCTFSNNSVSSPLNPLDTVGGAATVTADNGSRTWVLDSRFTGNSTTGAGNRSNALQGAAFGGGELLLERLYFYANTGAYNSLLAYDVWLVVDGAASRASFYDSQITYGTSGGLKVETNAVVELGHLTIAGYNGTGLDLLSDPSTGQAFLENSIVTANGQNVVVEPGSPPLIQTANMIGADPSFVNAVGGDYHLTAASPAVNAGTNGAATVRMFDLDHRTRIADGTTDIGCYEYGSLFADDFEVGDAGSWSP